MKILSLLVSLALVLTACTKGPVETTTGSAGDSNQAGNQGGGGITGTMAEMMARGVGMNCDYEIDGVEYQSQIKGQNYAGKIVKDGKVMNSIMANGMTYMWEEGKTAGIKMELDPATLQEETETETGTSDTPVATQYGSPNVQYRCLPGVVADSTFAPPVDVNFVDPFEMMGGNLTDEQMQALQDMGAGEEE